MGEFGKWPLADLLRERDSYRKNLDMARREMQAGNRRMHVFAEAYAKRLDALSFEITGRQRQNTPGTDRPTSDASDASDGSDVHRPFSTLDR